MADLSEISEMSCWERQSYYLDKYGGKRLIDREAAFEIAAFAAQADMLDEIHAMLRHLTLPSTPPRDGVE
jgi:hypothetical protein